MTPLPAARPSALTTTGYSRVCDVVAGRVGMVEDAELGGRHVGVAHQLLAKTLLASIWAAAFEGPKMRRPASERHRRCRSASGSSGPTTVRPMLSFLAKRIRSSKSFGVDRHVDAVDGGAGVARSAEDLLDARRLRQLPDQGVFAAALADDEDLHSVVPREIEGDLSPSIANTN